MLLHLTQAPASIDWRRFALVFGALSLSGIVALAVTAVPSIVFALVIALVVGAVAFTVPIWTFVPGTLLVIILSAQLGAFGAPDALFSTARLGVLLAAAVLVRAAVIRRAIRIPLTILLATAVFAAALIFSTLVGYAVSPIWPNGAGLRTGGETLFDHLQTQLLYVLAGLIIGLVVGANEGGRLRVFRGLAWVAIVASISSALYWGWESGFIGSVGPLDSVFEAARLDAIQAGGNLQRSGFPTGTNPNTQAVLFAALAGFVSPALFLSRRSADRRLATFVFVAAAAGVLSTQSRTGILLLGVVAVGLWTTSNPAPRSRSSILVALVAVVALVVFVSSALPEGRQFNEVGTLESRVAIWEALLTDFARSPVIGQGAGYGAAAIHGQSPHNEYLSRFVDGGIIGGVAFLFTLGLFIWAGWSLYSTKLDHAAGAGMLTFVAVLCGGMMTLTSWTTGGPTMFLSWMFFGMAGGMIAARRSQQSFEERTSEQSLQSL